MSTNVILGGLGIGYNVDSSEIITMGLNGIEASPFPLFIAGVVSFDQAIVLIFNTDFTLLTPALNPAYYSVSDGGAGHPITILSVTPDFTLNTITLATTTQSQQTVYTLTVSPTDIIGPDANPLEPPYVFTFNGASSQSVEIQIIKSIDSRILDIVFSIAVNEIDASNIKNFTISPPLGVESSIKITDFLYRLKTTSQTVGNTYTVTINDIGGA